MYFSVNNMEVFVKKIKQIFSLIVFLSMCVNFYAQGKNVTWKSMKPLEFLGENPIAVANTDTKNKAFSVSLSKEQTSVNAFFFFTQNSYNYSYPLSNPENERIIMALYDSKTGFFLDSICLEVSKDWKETLQPSKHAIGLMCHDKQNGNAFVYRDISSKKIDYVKLDSKTCEKGMFSFNPFGDPKDSLYYFWDSESKYLYTLSLKNKDILNSRIKMDAPQFFNLAESGEEKKERVVFVQEKKSGNEKAKLYMCIKDVFIDVSDKVNN